MSHKLVQIFLKTKLVLYYGMARQRIPQDLLTALAISAKDPLYKVLKKADYTMPQRDDAEFYNPENPNFMARNKEDYQVGALKNFLGGLGSSSAHHAVDELINNFENERIISYLADWEEAPGFAQGFYRKSVNPEDPDTAFVYHDKVYPKTTLAENALRILMHESFLHGVGGIHDMKSHHAGSPDEDYPMYGTQEDFDVMELELLEELKDEDALRDMYFKLKEMLPYNEKDRPVGDEHYKTSGILEKYEGHSDLKSFLESLVEQPASLGLPRKVV